MSEAMANTPGIQLGRRHLLAGIAALAGTAVVAGPGRGVFDLLPFIGGHDPFTRTAVLARVGETFRIVDGAYDGVRIAVAAITDLPDTTPTIPDDQFMAQFTSTTSGAELPAGMYWFATGSFGRLPLFVTPMADGDGRVTGYQAVINRYVPANTPSPPTRRGGPS
jgi:hypothetical protein